MTPSAKNQTSSSSSLLSGFLKIRLDALNLKILKRSLLSFLYKWAILMFSGDGEWIDLQWITCFDKLLQLLFDNIG